MTKTEINVVIAKGCGWTKTDATRGYTLSQFPEYLPDYCSDLNAMCAAWKEKFGYFSEEWLSAHLQLQKIVAEDEGEEDTQDPYIQAATATATAYQRAKAFCKNLNLWTQTNMKTKEPFKQMTVGKLIALLKEFPANEPICMTSRLEQSTKFTAINYVGREDHGNIVISLKDSLL